METDRSTEEGTVSTPPQPSTANGQHVPPPPTATPPAAPSASAEEYQRLVRLALQQRGGYAERDDPPAPGPGSPGMRVTEIHETYERNVRRMELRMRLIAASRFLALIPLLAAVLYLAWGWRNLNRSVYEAREELKQVAGILHDRTGRVRALVPVGDPMPNERKYSDQIVRSGALVQSDEVEKQVTGIRQWNAALRPLTAESKRRAQRLTPQAYAELSGTLDGLKVREREYLRRYNRAAESYNALSLAPPQSLVRSLGRFPMRLPIYVSNE